MMADLHSVGSCVRFMQDNDHSSNDGNVPLLHFVFVPNPTNKTISLAAICDNIESEGTLSC
jgi:hypothetical protein